MIQNSKNTAVLVFVRSLKEELRVKTLIKNDFNKNVQLFNALNQGVKQLARSTSLPVFLVDTEQQVGHTFVERFKYAFQTIFNKGFDNVISIGNDVPDLNKDNLIDLIAAFEKNDTVYGATTKNGLYTVGFSKQAFDKVDFSRIRWQSTSVLPSFKEEISRKQLTSYSSHEILEDINNPNQLKRFISRRVVGSSFYILFFQILSKTLSKNYKIYTAPNLALKGSKSILFRGPPVSSY